MSDQIKSEGHKVSMTFSKQIKKKTLAPSALRAPTEKPANTAAKEIIESIEDNQILSNAPIEEELIIPLVKQDRAATFKERAKKKIQSQQVEAGGSEDRVLTLDEMAEKALIEEAKNTSATDKPSTANAVIIAQDESDNQKTDGKLSSIDDYEEVTVSTFGLAMLRGMGYEKGKGVGNERNRQVVNIIEPTNRSLDSTAKTKRTENGAESSQDEELPLVTGAYLRIVGGRNKGNYGTVVCVDEDHLLVNLVRDDKGKLALTGNKNVIREVPANVEVITAAEFKKTSRVINQEMYDEFKAKQDGEKESRKSSKSKSKSRDDEKEIKSENDKEMMGRSESKEVKVKIAPIVKEEIKDVKSEVNGKRKDNECRSDSENDKEFISKRRKYEETSFKQDPKYSGVKLENSNFVEKSRRENRYEKDSKDNYHHSNSHSPKRDERRSHHNSVKYESFSEKYDRKNRDRDRKGKSDDYKSESNSILNKYGNCSQSYGSNKSLPWVCEGLTVRIICEKYKKGRYFKEKVTVREVLTAEDIECVTSSGKILYKLSPAMLETVIPKADPKVVKVIKGEYTGQVGRILDINKRNQCAQVQMLSDKSVIASLRYHYICQYKMT